MTRFRNIACLPFLIDFGTDNHRLIKFPGGVKTGQTFDVFRQRFMLRVEKLITQIKIWIALTETGKRCTPNNRAPRLF